ncbi:MAG TPA: tripartite tricarboxylate transporter substrate-binding protein, partial [Burkholderiaceae bacterium]|nr:tripartite tricarboxylate transporter substrate-binding protein [Burkholderiaceae bacterium]
VTILAPYVREGKVKGLVLFGTRRSPQLPDVPTSIEAGYPDLQMSNAYGILAPAGVPAATRGQLEQAILQVVRSPEVSAKLGNMGLNGPMDTAEFKAKLARDFDRWIPFLKKTGIQVQP